MKKILALFLALLLFASMSASAVMAEEPTPEEVPEQEGFTPAEEETEPFIEDYPLTEDTVYETKRTRPNMLPNLAFGTDLNEAVLKIMSEFQASRMSFDGEPQQDTITLSNGIPYQVVSISGNTSLVENGQFVTSVYGTDTGKVIGAVYDISAEKPELLSYFRNIMVDVYGEPIPLVMSALGNFAELAGESAHLESGQDMWSYTYTAKTGGDPANNPENTSALIGTAVITMHIVDDHAYIAEYLDPNRLTVSGAAEAGPINVEGFDKLGANEQIAVRLYAEYLDKQFHDALQVYVNFLLERNKQTAAPSNEIIE